MTSSNRMAVFAAVLSILSVPTESALAAPAVSAPTPSAASACAEPGLSFQWANVPGEGNRLPNELSRNLGGVAIRVLRDNCTIDLVCVSGDKTPEAKALASHRCVLVRDVIVKLNKKKGFTKDNMRLKHRAPGAGLQPNMVYLTFR